MDYEYQDVINEEGIMIKIATLIVKSFGGSRSWWVVRVIDLEMGD